MSCPFAEPSASSSSDEEQQPGCILIVRIQVSVSQNPHVHGNGKYLNRRLHIEPRAVHPSPTPSVLCIEDAWHFIGLFRQVSGMRLRSVAIRLGGSDDRGVFVRPFRTSCFQ